MGQPLPSFTPAFVVATSKAKVGLQINPTFPLAPTSYKEKQDRVETQV